MYVSLYVYVYVYVCIHIYIYIYTYIHIHIVVRERAHGPLGELGVAHVDARDDHALSHEYNTTTKLKLTIINILTLIQLILLTM